MGYSIFREKLGACSICTLSGRYSEFRSSLEDNLLCLPDVHWQKVQEEINWHDHTLELRRRDRCITWTGDVYLSVLSTYSQGV